MVRSRAPRAAILLVTALALALATLVGCGADAEPTSDQTAPAFDSLEAPVFARKMSEPGTTLLDVRTPDEFRHGHIEGARNISLEGEDFENRIEELDPDRTYALYCRSDRRSGHAMQVMAEHGLGQVYDLDGGMDAWKAYGGAVTR